MNQPKPKSLAITVVILLCMFHVTLITVVICGALTSFNLEHMLPILYYCIDYILPITFLVSLLNAVRIEDDIFLKKLVLNGKNDNVIIASSSYSIMISFVAVLTVKVIQYVLTADIGFLILHVFLFGGLATYYFTNYIVGPIFFIINTIISPLTNSIFNIIFAKHLRKKII